MGAESLHFGPRMVGFLMRCPAHRTQCWRMAGHISVLFIQLDPSWAAQGLSAELIQVCLIWKQTVLLCRAECWRTTGRPPYATSSTAWRACARARPAWRWTPAGAWCACSTPARRTEPRSQAPAEIRCKQACTAPAWTLPRSGGSRARPLRSASMKSGAVHPGCRANQLRVYLRPGLL